MAASVSFIGEKQEEKKKPQTQQKNNKALLGSPLHPLPDLKSEAV